MDDEDEQQEEQEQGEYYICDKCGGQFSSEWELDHHDKTDH